MTTAKRLQQIVREVEQDPYALGQLVCRLRNNELVVQEHKDGAKLDVFWNNKGAFWRCTIWLDETAEACLIQADLYPSGTIRVEAHQPCSVTVDLEEEILSVTRLLST